MSEATPLSFCTLASGSSGNACLVRIGGASLLIDAGVGSRTMARALRQVGASLDELDAVLVTHEHTDHVSGLASVLKARPDVPAFATGGTARACAEFWGWRPQFELIAAGVVYEVAGVEVTPFSTPHDARESVGFVLRAGGRSLALVTDLGHWTERIARVLDGVEVLLLEANHDVRMLAGGPYPARLKRRIASERGHLSNADAAALLGAVDRSALRHVELVHLSERNNLPSLAIDTVRAALGPGVGLGAAPRDAGALRVIDDSLPLAPVDAEGSPDPVVVGEEPADDTAQGVLPL